MVKKPERQKEAKIKIRGFTLSYASARKLNFKTLRRLVRKYVRFGLREKVPVVQPQIVRTQKIGEVVTKDQSKDYGVTYDKRWILEDFSTLPFGTCEE